MIVEPATVVLLTMAFAVLLGVMFLPFAIRDDEDLRIGTFFGSILVMAVLALGLAALVNDFDHSLNNAKTLERSCPR